MAYTIGVVFIETSVFTKEVTKILSRESYKELQWHLFYDPLAGSIVAGTGGIRKLRWSLNGRGKRGGVRILYYYVGADNTIYMLFLYQKNKQADLTQNQKAVLMTIVRELNHG